MGLLRSRVSPFTPDRNGTRSSPSGFKAFTGRSSSKLYELNRSSAWLIYSEFCRSVQTVSDSWRWQRVGKLQVSLPYMCNYVHSAH